MWSMDVNVELKFILWVNTATDLQPHQSQYEEDGVDILLLFS